MDFEQYKEILFEKIRVLNETIWGGDIKRGNIESWLGNFEGDMEQINALYLLSQFMFFGNHQMREMMKVLFRDFYKYPIVEEIRRKNNNSIDLSFINSEFQEKLNSTRFLGIGDNAESGNHLLYFFRQENSLSTKLFINRTDIFKLNTKNCKTFEEIIDNNDLFDKTIKHYVFIDDLCGSGSQAKKYSKSIIRSIKHFDSEIKVSYLVLFLTKEGKEVIKRDTLFDSVDSIFELDDSFKCFSDTSRYYKQVNIEDYIVKDYMKEVASKHGREMMEIFWKKENIASHKIKSFAVRDQLGFGNCQLLLGLYHNTPDNTLPIFWYNEGEKNWHPIFKRYNKVY